MDSQNPFEGEISLNQWKVGNSVREVSNGSRGGDLEMSGLSQKEIGDDDARLVYLNDPVKNNERYEFAVFGRGASIMPLAFVLSVTAVKDAYEDWRRQGSDRVENNRLACVLVDDQFRPKK
ncbi:phospholipid-transporting ATPase 1 [Populus trichocarpa]|uniref:Uncharacterized protein n=1 Tax=Populus trichocarpa TaxID=3694 RepID=A0A3N7FTV7_POPTR|nr:phospholipid-transporting ATPase 1 [Populus trichocarpa]|eukprot:XP_024465593.1 phospholipid-transporting ATPase 1 [Populus trichocarpa]